jgi:hypothetical protein
MVYLFDSSNYSITVPHTIDVFDKVKIVEFFCDLVVSIVLEAVVEKVVQVVMNNVSSKQMLMECFPQFLLLNNVY